MNNLQFFPTSSPHFLPHLVSRIESEKGTFNNEIHSHFISLFPYCQSHSMEFLIYENAEYEWNEMKWRKKRMWKYLSRFVKDEKIIIKMRNYDERLYADGEVSHRISVIIFMIKCYNVMNKGRMWIFYHTITDCNWFQSKLT